MQRLRSSRIGRLWTPSYSISMQLVLQPVASHQIRWNQRVQAPRGSLACLGTKAVAPPHTCRADTRIVVALVLALIVPWIVARRNPRGLTASGDQAHHPPVSSHFTTNCSKTIRSPPLLKELVLSLTCFVVDLVDMDVCLFLIMLDLPSPYFVLTVV